MDTIKGQTQLKREIVAYDPYEFWSKPQDKTFATVGGKGDPIHTAAWVVMHTNGLVEAYVQPRK